MSQKKYCFQSRLAKKIIYFSMSFLIFYAPFAVQIMVSIDLITDNRGSSCLWCLNSSKKPDKQLANMLQTVGDIVSILANLFTYFILFVNSYLTFE